MRPTVLAFIIRVPLCGFFQGGGAKGDGPYSDSNCFIGPLKWMKFKKKDTFEYEYFLILGTDEDVRGFAYEQQGKKLKRKEESRTRYTLDKPEVTQQMIAEAKCHSGSGR